jgi:hypothetical protein
VKVFDTLRVIVPGRITDTVRTVMTNYSGDDWFKILVPSVIGTIIGGSLTFGAIYFQTKSKEKKDSTTLRQQLWIELHEQFGDFVNIILQFTSIPIPEENAEKESVIISAERENSLWNIRYKIKNTILRLSSFGIKDTVHKVKFYMTKNELTTIKEIMNKYWISLDEFRERGVLEALANDVDIVVKEIIEPRISKEYSAFK